MFHDNPEQGTCPRVGLTSRELHEPAEPAWRAAVRVRGAEGELREPESSTVRQKTTSAHSHPSSLAAEVLCFVWLKEAIFSYAYFIFEKGKFSKRLGLIFKVLDPHISKRRAYFK